MFKSCAPKGPFLCKLKSQQPNKSYGAPSNKGTVNEFVFCSDETSLEMESDEVAEFNKGQTKLVKNHLKHINSLNGQLASL